MAMDTKLARGDILNSRKPLKINYREANPHRGLSNVLLDPKVLPKVVRDEMERNRRAREMVRKLAMKGWEEIERLADEAEAILKKSWEAEQTKKK